MQSSVNLVVVLVALFLTACSEEPSTYEKKSIRQESRVYLEPRISDENCTPSNYSYVDPDIVHDECYNYCSPGCGPNK